MNKSTKLSELTLEELYQQKKKLQGVFLGLAIVLFVAEIILLYVAFTVEGMGSLAAVALCTAMAFIPAAISISQINSEIKSRNA
jgi:hypothetical protein